MSATRRELELLENHHRFMALHRGTVDVRDGAVRWDSASAYFRCVLLMSPAGLREVRDDTRAVRTFPWSGDLVAALEGRGFRRAGELRTMVAETTRVVPEGGPAGIAIDLAVDELDMARFSDVQSRGFADPGEDVEALRTFLHPANLRNLGHPAQRFYVGAVEGRPVAVTLSLIVDATCGIYAVATLPEHRRHGYSRALLSRACADARAHGCDVVTLQVFRGSDAERVYTRLGFEVAFDGQLWER